MTLYAGNLKRQWQAIQSQFESLEPSLPILAAVQAMTPHSLDNDGLIVNVRAGDETWAVRSRSTLENISAGIFDERVKIQFVRAQ